MNTLATVPIIVKATVLIALAATIDMLLRGRTSAASRHLVWTLALGGLLALPLLSLVVPSWKIPVRLAYEPPREAVAATGARSSERSIETTVEPSIATAFSAPGVASEETRAVALVASSSPTRAFLGNASWINALIATYVAGVFALVFRLIHGRLTLLRLVRESAEVSDPSWCELLRDCESALGVSRPVRLLRNLDRTMPMAFGVRTPTILIPAIADSWSHDRRRVVFLHEMAHIARRDCLTQLLSAIACAAYWMHPGVWWMALRLRVERERACDDRVVSAGTPATDYATHLLELAYSLGGYRSPALVVSMAGSRQIEGRMLAVLDGARSRVVPPLLLCALAVAVTAAVVVPLAAAEAVATPISPAATASFNHSSSAGSTPSSAIRSSSESETAVAQTLPSIAAPAPPPPPVPPAAPSARHHESDSGEVALPGTWELRRSESDAAKAHLRLSDRPRSWHGFDVTLDQLEGLSSSWLAGEGGSVKFQLKRDAGSLVFDGTVRNGVGAGTFNFTPSPTFPAEMKRRGFETPNATEQYQLARGDVGLDYLDELNAGQYEEMTPTDLVRACDHGVSLDYLKRMRRAGYTFRDMDQLVQASDHGVTPAYIEALASVGYKNVPFDTLLRARDHGVSAQFAGVMEALGYAHLSLDELIRATDHGVSVEFVRGMAQAGHQDVPVEMLIRARDHGVDPDFVKAMREAGYGTLSLDDLIVARDHGVDEDYVHGMMSVTPERPSLQDLVQARDHGVDADFARGWRNLGFAPMLSDMITARDHGVSAEYARELKELGYERLSVDELVRLRDHGVSAAFVRGQNATSAKPLSVNELIRRRDRGME